MSGMRVARGSLALAVLLGAASPPRADPPPGRAATPAGHRPALSFTISGGVSLGAYEAGFLYYALEASRRSPALPELRLVTGASAGSANGLIAVLAQCQERAGEPPEDPRDSLFWRTWIPTGLRELYLPADVVPQGAFSRRFLETAAGRIEQAFQAGLSEACDVVFGVAVTRLEPRTVRAARGRLELPSMEEKFALRIRGRGKGLPPSVTNYVQPGHEFEQVMLPAGADGEVAFSSLRDLVFASTAFPLAFPPQRLAHCAIPPGAAPECPASAAIPALFVDGGVFDNSPLRLASRLAGAGLREGPGRATWLDVPRLEEFAPPPSMRFGYVSVDATAYPPLEQPQAGQGEASLLGFLRRFSGSLVSTARSKELYTLLEQHPEVGERILPAPRHYPAAGDPMAAFFGFFDEQFRAFDFYLGMYEARRTLDELAKDRAPGAVAEVHRPEPFGEAWPEGGPAAWRPLACMRGVLDDVAALREACAGADLREFRILLQTSLERLYDRCAAAGDRWRPATPNPRCQAAAGGEAPPAVPGVDGAGTTAWRRAPGEPEVDYVLRLLAAHRFRFAGLGLTPEAAGDALPRIRRVLGDMAARLASVQPASERPLVTAAGKIAVNLLAYAPPRNVISLTLGRELELGWTRGLPETFVPEWLRLHLAIQVHGFAALLSSDRLPFALGALAGVETMPPGLSTAGLQLTGAVRAGWVFSKGDRWGTAPCDGPFAGEIGGCSRFVSQVYVAVSALEVVRLQLAGEWYPAVRAGQKGLWSASPAIGFQLAF
jgi:hypothetical protein